MPVLFQMFVALVVFLLTYLIYVWALMSNVRKKLRWVPSSRLVPFLGSSLEFGSNKEIINDMTRLTDNPSKMIYLEVGLNWGIASRNYDLTEFVMSSNIILNKGTFYDLFHEWLGTGLLTAPGQKWKKRRRIITPAFHFSILEQFVDIFDSNGQIMIQKLYTEALNKESVDIYQYVTACALDVISESAMGVSVKTQENKNQDYVSAVKDLCRITTSRATSALRRLNFVFRLTKDYRKQKDYIEILHGFTNRVIEERKKELETKKEQAVIIDELGRKRKLAFLDLLLSSTIDGQPLSQEDIREEVDTFMFEGHDTTASGISSALYLLARYPEFQEKVRNEQKELFGDDKDAPTTYQILQDMKYLELVIKETMRLYPPVPLVSRKTTQDIEYKGNIIPKDTILTTFIYGMNRDPDYFECPEEFKPERFLSNHNRPYSFIPFSAGPRNCIGQKFAMLEMKSMISKITRNFELCCTNPPHQPNYVSEAVFKSVNGVRVKLKEHNWSK